jgi:hypothetical protein
MMEQRPMKQVIVYIGLCLDHKNFLDYFFSNINYCRALNMLASGISEATSASGTLSTGTDNVMYETGEPSEGGSMGTRLTAEDECSCML